MPQYTVHRYQPIIYRLEQIINANLGKQNKNRTRMASIYRYFFVRRNLNNLRISSVFPIKWLQGRQKSFIEWILQVKLDITRMVTSPGSENHEHLQLSRDWIASEMNLSDSDLYPTSQLMVLSSLLFSAKLIVTLGACSNFEPQTSLKHCDKDNPMSHTSSGLLKQGQAYSLDDPLY